MKQIQHVGIVGAGAMGRGIAQIAAQAGLRVSMYDAAPTALASAREFLQQTWEKLVQRGKLDAAQAAAALEAIEPCEDLSALRECDLVIEAIVERLDAKQNLFRQLEDIVSSECILASNTSSLSITAIASACARPSRVAGYHFFNPVPLMKVVEVVDGLRSDPAVGDALAELARRMGHTPVRAKDMPGFIVNHAGRGLNTEGLRVLQEGVATCAQVDAIMTEQAGFKMGPFELMDLTGLDVSHPVMESIYTQFFDEPRFRPSPVTTVRLAGGLLGRKTGQGFYTYVDGKKQVQPETPRPSVTPLPEVWVSPVRPDARAAVVELLLGMEARVQDGPHPGDDALIVVTPYGEDATTAACDQGLDARRTVAVDTLHGLPVGRRRTLMATPLTESRWLDAAAAQFSADGAPVTVIQDSPGFVAQRIVATIVNIACEIAQQRIATPADIDQAVRLGLGYPQGPLAMGDALGAARIVEILRNLVRVTGDMRYRPSLWLQRRAQLGMSLLAG
ncbi:3-hydroxyacyl-CoA dehydrogenase [Pigmentiphaga sp.]|jgi:3-hydroxyacyl-CoA dehydrogenase|uniref:3-hydroxyacyl-CoA dehydrogenase n=1 Tax=Pigmentiphaga sp. TaxID=1977564 RepID=UPI0025F8C687|nr:3-hydroxyacyl-CoA dehydrogenase [Pigmentiphaga sp.]MBX6318950.1 3-hydroxyacyl-CoA dehydrogenase [Pigmentiphaga sp.]